jgi:hypothetical protein
MTKNIFDLSNPSLRTLLFHVSMEPHGQSPWFPKDAHKGRTSRTRGPNHPQVEPVVLLVRERRNDPSFLGMDLFLSVFHP